jgi:uncharacterized protein (TIGR03000 family)
MRVLPRLSLVAVGTLAACLAVARDGTAGIIRGPYDYSLGPYRGSQGWSYNESYGYYGVPWVNSYSWWLWPYGYTWPYINGYRYYPPYPKYLMPYGPGYIKAMARNVAMPTLNAVDGAAVIEVKLPFDAELRVDGMPTEQLGTDRAFRSPPLERGSKYVYEVRASWVENGKVIQQTQEVTVRSGDRVQIAFPKDVAPVQPISSEPRPSGSGDQTAP